MKIHKQKKALKIPKFGFVRIKECGLTTELVYQPQQCNQIFIRNVDKEHYLDLKTGELLEKKHIKNRSEDVRSLKKSMRDLRDIINTNVVDVFKCKWLTLTYAENMTDSKKLYNDFKKFFKRFRYSFKDYKVEYISVAEPQSRGAWHLHVILIFDKNPGFIDSNLIASIWKHGFVKTTRIDNVDNVGAYLSAYLSDLPIEELPQVKGYDIQEDIINHHNGAKMVKDKKYLKGARLYMYPPKFNLYRCSRGIKKPLIKTKLYDTFITERKKEGVSTQPSFSNTIILKFDNCNDVILTRHYYKNFISRSDSASQVLP